MISVIIPLYNKGHVIVNTLRTVFAQTFQNFEVVIVDDGSTDDGVQIIKINFDDSRIRIYTQQNSGVSVARNKGVEEALYEYVAFLDGDDEWHPDYLEKVKQMIDLYPDAAMYCTGGLCIGADGSTHYRLAEKYIGKILKINYFDSPYVFSHTSATTIRKSVFNKSSKFPVGMRRSQDLSCFFEVALLGDTVYCGLPLSKYVGGIEGQATSKNNDIIKYMYFLTNKFANEIIYSHNSDAKKFFRYDIRHRIKVYSKKGIMEEYYKNLSIESKSLLTWFETFLYKRRNIFLIPYINLTKLFWRLRRCPIVGDCIDEMKIPVTFRKW